MGLKIQLIYLKFLQLPLPESKRLLASVKGSKISREIKNVLPLPETLRNAPRSKAANIPRNQDMLPLPETRRNARRSKAANVPRNQESAAFAGDPKKCASVKGSKCPEKSRMCCLCRETRTRNENRSKAKYREIKNVLPLPKT